MHNLACRSGDYWQQKLRYHKDWLADETSSSLPAEGGRKAEAAPWNTHPEAWTLQERSGAAGLTRAGMQE